MLNKKSEKNEKELTNSKEQDRTNYMKASDYQEGLRYKEEYRIEGKQRIQRTANRPSKKAISRYNRHIFDPGVMSLHQQEISYGLVEQELIKLGIITELVAEFNAEKEASIYIAHLNDAPLVVKAYRFHLTSHKKVKGNPQTLSTAYAVMEFDRMLRAFQAGVRCPAPAKQINNILVMTFIGQDFIPALQLKDTILK
jgi:serine/threonine-protein kinase RIO1